MKKKFLLFLITLFTCLFSVKAASVQYFNVTDEKGLDDCLNKDDMCQLTSDIKITSVKTIENRTVLDLNGHIIQPSSDLELDSGLLLVGRGGKLTIEDSSGTGKITSGNNIMSAIQMIDPGDTGEETAELVLNSGTLEGYNYGISGNGKRDNTSITVNGGNIKTIDEDSVGIYQPQMGKIVINGGIIEGGTGIEVRSGDLTVNNGNIKGTSSFLAKANASGTTTVGTGITVAQHTTKNPINVQINGGNISGQNAFYEWNPQKNDKDSINKVNISINGGNFKTTLSGGAAVYSEDLTGFIHGGTFNTDVSKYKAADAKSVAKVLDSTKSSNSGIGVFYVILGLAALFVAYYLYKQYKRVN